MGGVPTLPRPTSYGSVSRPLVRCKLGQQQEVRELSTDRSRSKAIWPGTTFSLFFMAETAASGSRRRSGSVMGSGRGNRVRGFLTAPGSFSGIASSGSACLGTSHYARKHSGRAARRSSRNRHRRSGGCCQPSVSSRSGVFSLSSAPFRFFVFVFLGVLSTFANYPLGLWLFRSKAMAPFTWPCTGMGSCPSHHFISGYLLSLESDIPIDFGIEYKMHAPPTIHIAKVPYRAQFFSRVSS